MTDIHIRFLPLRLHVSLLVLLTGVGCGTAEPGPARVMALVLSADGGYAPRAVELSTLTSLSTMKGDVAQFIVGARYVKPDLKALSNDQLQTLIDSKDARLKVFMTSLGREAHPSFLKANEVYWPTDFDSWGMTSAYYALEKTTAYFKTLADDLPELHQMTVYYSAELYFDQPPGPFPPDNGLVGLHDNAAYVQAVDAIFLSPSTSKSTLPTAENFGVIAHETSHRIFSTRALAGFFLSPFATLATRNLGSSLDEGLADFHAAGVICLEESGCKPGFAQDLGVTELSLERDLARPDACMTSTLREGLKSDPFLVPYKVGSLFSASLYQTGVKTGHLHDLQRAVLASYNDESAQTPGLQQLIFKAVKDPTVFTVEAVVDTFASHIADPALRRAWCGEAADRLRLECASFPCERLPSCPAESVRGSSCPDLVTP